jgi:hypothetical protein
MSHTFKLIKQKVNLILIEQDFNHNDDDKKQLLTRISDCLEMGLWIEVF